MAATPKIVAWHIGEEKQDVNNRFTALTDKGLIEPAPDPETGEKFQGVYVLTDLGRRLTTDDLTVAELRELLSGRGRG